MTTSNPNKARLALLRKYLEEREAIQAAIYRLVRFAAELELDHREMESVTALLKPLDDKPYRIRHEIEELEKKP